MSNDSDRLVEELDNYFAKPMSNEERIDDLIQEIYHTGFQVGQYTQPADHTLENRLAVAKAELTKLIDEETTKARIDELENFTYCGAEADEIKSRIAELKERENSNE